jgi:hypothetical protein
MTEIVLNTTKEEENYFDLEAKLTRLRKFKNTYTIAVFD